MTYFFALLYKSLSNSYIYSKLQIADLVTIRENKSTLENEIQTLTEQKLELDTFISENTTTKTSLSDEIRRLALEKLL